MIRTRALACIAIATLGSAVSAPAQTQQVCFSASLPDLATNWEADAHVPRFDTGLGTLVSVDVQSDSSLTATASVESLDATPTVVRLQFQITVTVNLPDGQLLPVTVPLGSFNDSLGPFDGTVDFAGTSGMTHAGIHATDSHSASAQDIV